MAWCESKLDPGAVSPTNDHGLFQISAVHQQEFVEVTGQLWHMVYAFRNTVDAKHLDDTQGWQPWVSPRHHAA